MAGFDDIPVARFLAPPLTTVGAAIADLGARAIERLLEVMQRAEPRQGQREVLPTTLVVRGSCAAAAAPSPPSQTTPPRRSV